MTIIMTHDQPVARDLWHMYAPFRGFSLLYRKAFELKLPYGVPSFQSPVVGYTYGHMLAS
jgi:hypothetical protein